MFTFFAFIVNLQSSDLLPMEISIVSNEFCLASPHF